MQAVFDEEVITAMASLEYITTHLVRGNLNEPLRNLVQRNGVSSCSLTGLHALPCSLMSTDARNQSQMLFAKLEDLPIRPHWANEQV